MDIVFTEPTPKVEITNDKIYSHVFKGHNISLKTIKKLSVTKGCSCTEVICPDTIGPNEEFEVTAIIDKVGKTGLFSVSMHLNFDNNQTVKLNIAGKLIVE